MATASTTGTGRLTRALGGLSLGALAIITAIISYRHGLTVVRATGTTGWVAYLVPLVADLMIFASSLALLDSAQRNMRRPPLAVASLAFGIVATVAMNVAAGWAYGWGGRLVSALAPVALVLSYETLMGMVRRGREHVTVPGAGASGEHVDACPHGVAESIEDAALLAFLHRRDCLDEEVSRRQVAETFGIHRNRLGALVREHDDPTPEEVHEESPVAALNGQAGAAV